MKLVKILSLVLALAMLASCGSTTVKETTNTEDTENSVDTTETAASPDEEQGMPEALASPKMTLRFDENGEFKILMMGDVQASAPQPSDLTLNAIRTVTEREDPDLVIFSGDNATNCGSEEALRSYIDAMTAVMTEKGIPWMHVYGNHDEDGSLSRAEQQAIYESYPLCVSKAGPEELFGVGNYVVPIYGSDETSTEPVFAVWGMDSGNYYTDEGLAGEGAWLGTPMFRGIASCKYGYLPFSSVMWYHDTSEEIEAYLGRKLPGLMCFHIAIQEFYEVFLNKDQESVNFTGDAMEGIGSGPLNSGMFSAIVERGDIKAVVCGHDHLNYFSGDYAGVKLCYSGAITFDHYHNETITGARVFVIHEDNPEEIETYMSFLYGINLQEAESVETLTADFEEDSIFAVSEGSTVTAEDGANGSAGLAVSGETTLELDVPYTLGESRHLTLWADVAEGSKLTSVAIDGLHYRYTADLATQSFYIMPEGETEWTKVKKGEGLPDGFTGRIALSLGAFIYGESERPAIGSYLWGYTLSAEGDVTVDEIRCSESYK